MSLNVISIKPYPSTWPPDSGGQQRSYYLYAHLPPDFQTIVIEPSLTPRSERITQGKLTYIRWRKPWLSAGVEILASLLNRHHTDNLAVLDVLALLSPTYRRTLSQAISPDSIVCVEHCYAYGPLLTLPRRALIYSAHNVEYDLKQATTPRSLLRPLILRQAYIREKTLCQKATQIITCTEADKVRLHELYGVSLEKISVIPNGSDTQRTTPPSATHKEQLRKSLHIQKLIALFIGSSFPPNTEAATYIKSILAPQFPNIHFVIAGSVGTHFTSTEKYREADLIRLASPHLGYGFMPLNYWLNRLGRWVEPTFGIYIQNRDVTAVELTSASFIPGVMTLRLGKKTSHHGITPWPRQTKITILDQIPQWIHGHIIPSMPTTNTRRLGMAIQRLHVQREGVWEKIDIGHVHNTSRAIAPNITVIEDLTDQQKHDLLIVSDIALNPVSTGSGSHLKMFEYMASGIPIVTTPVGARGFTENRLAIMDIAELDQFPGAVARLARDSGRRNRLGETAHQYVKRHHDWQDISKRYADILTSMFR